MKAPPESTKASLKARLNAHGREHWPNLAGVDCACTLYVSSVTPTN